MPEPYPWQAALWQRLTGLAAGARLPHALLLAGAADLGKLAFAKAFCGYLLCHEPGQASACGACASCHLVQAGTHPDQRLVAPEDSRQIRIEQIRELTHWASQSALQGGRKAALLAPADAMNPAAANALLKCLEEPAGETFLLLVTAQPARLLATIRSRCQWVRFAMPPRAEALAFLRERRTDAGPASLLDLAGGAPLRALAYDAAFLEQRQALAQGLGALQDGSLSPLAFAQTLAKGEPATMLDILYSLVADAITCHTVEDKEFIKNKDLRAEVASLCNSMGGERLQALLARIVQVSQLAAGASNASLPMLYEWLLASEDNAYAMLGP